MAISRIEGGLSSLIEYARDVKKDPQLADRLVDEQDRLRNIFIEAGLQNVDDPLKETRLERSSRAQERETVLANHMAAVAREALRVENGHFVHHTRMDVARFLQSNQVPGFNLCYKDGTVSHQIGEVAQKIYAMTGRVHVLKLPLFRLVEIDMFQGRRQGLSSGWVEFFKYANSIFPPETTPLHLGRMFLEYPRLTLDLTPREAFKLTKVHLQ